MKFSALLLILSGTLLTALFQVCEREPNDTLAEATSLEVHPIFDQAVLAAGWLDRSDVDHFAFEAHAGDVVTVALRDETGGEVADALLAVFGPDDDKKPIAEIDDVGSSLAPRVALPIDTTGTHTIAVTGFGDEKRDGSHREAFEYRLTVTRAPEFAERDDTGQNDDRAHPGDELIRPKQLLPRGAVVVSGTLTPGDVDHYWVPLIKGAVVTASLYDDANGEFNDALLTLRDDTDKKLASDDDAGPGRLPRITYATGATEGAAVLSVDGYDEDGDAATPHTEDFAYRLVFAIEDPLDHP